MLFNKCSTFPFFLGGGAVRRGGGLGLFPGGEQHVRHAVADAALRLLHHMAVDAGGGGNAAVAQPVAYADAVHPMEEQHAGHGVAEGMGV